MTQSPQQPGRPGPFSGELALSIARDMEDIADRIAEMKALCDRQMAELADAAAAAAGIAEALARRQPPGTDAIFQALTSELSHLEATVAAQVEVYRTISRQFLEIARRVGAEITALREAGGPPAGASGAPPVPNVVWLSTRRGARDEAIAQAGAHDLREALQAMQGSTIALFAAQAESGKLISGLRQRMRDHRHRTRQA